MGGAASVDDTLAHTVMIAYSLQSGLTGESIYPYNGNLMGGSVTGWFTIDFVTPVVDFGGYFGTADDLQGGTVTFFDDTGATIDSGAFPLAYPQWTWYGWHSDTPIKSILIHGAASPGPWHNSGRLPRQRARAHDPDLAVGRCWPRASSSLIESSCKEEILKCVNCLPLHSSSPARRPLPKQ